MRLSIRIQKLLVSPFRLLLILWSLVSLSAADAAPGTVNLAWNANPETDIAGYRVHYGTTSGNLDRIVTVGTTPEATLSGLEPGALYHCSVQAFNTSELASPLSAEIAFVAPGAATFPEIAVEQASGSVLNDGQSGVSFTKVDLGSTGAAETFFIKNLGTGYLTGLAITTESNEFTVAPLGTATLAPGETTSFNVTFKPTAAGDRVAFIHISSNDADENPFDIGLIARGVAVPEITIQHPSGSDLADSTATIHFSNSLLGSTSTAETFTIKNTGSADLTGLAISASGTESGDFILSPPAVAILAPGASTTFSIAFRPSVSGLRTATIHVASNDADESPFDIALVGSGVANPEIAIQNSTASDLADGTASINFGGVNLGATSAAETYTIKNLGTANLTGIAITADGDHASNFTITVPPVTALAPGASTTFKVAFKPTAGGPRSSTLHITSNDADENPFDIALSGTGIAFPDISITQAGGSSLTGGLSSVNLGSVNLGATGAAQTFTVANLGNASLSDLGVAVHGVHDSDFLVESLATNSIAQGASATFKVTFKPTAAGTRTATLHVTSNDPDESPFHIALSGNGVAFPVLALESANGTPVANSGAAIQFGGVVVGTTGNPAAYTVRNSGTSALTGLQVTITGADETSFVLAAPATSTLAPGASTTFSVSFRPTAGGPKGAVVQIANNATAGGPLVVGLNGNGIAFPEIAVLSDGANLTSGNATLSLGNCNLGSTTATRTVTIKNSGTAALTGLAVASDSSEFKAGSLGATTLAPGASTTFKVSFAPSAVGARAATLAVASNDADENQFLIALTGTGTVAPEIVVAQSNGKSLVDENAFINFGTVNVGTTAKAQTFTIRNSGTATLAGLTLVKNGINPGDFTVTALKTKSLAPGASTTIKVAFKPAKAGTRWGAIHITSNDADESSFDIILTGTGKKSATTKAATAKTSVAKNVGTMAPPVKGTAVIDGRKYRTLTITKTAGTTILPRDIEVSSDLVAWASGKQHTTVLLNNTKTLKVRDNTPLTQDAKRYIRLKR